MPRARRAGTGRGRVDTAPTQQGAGRPPAGSGPCRPSGGSLLPHGERSGCAGGFCSSHHRGLTVSPRGPSSSIRVPLGALGDGEAGPLGDLWPGAEGRGRGFGAQAGQPGSSRT